MEEDKNNDLNSTIEESAPTLPLFKVEVQGAVKHGESVMFTLEVKATASKEEGKIILREFEDFEWLHHNLLTSNELGGVIVPPLPTKPLSDPKAAENLSKKQLGNQTNIMKGDQFDVHAKSIGIYLTHMLTHPVFGVDNQLSQFLSEETAPVKARLNKGLMTRLSWAFDSARKGNYKDIDEFFTKERQNSLDFNKLAKELSTNYNKLLLAQWRLSSSYRTVVTDLMSSTVETNDGLVHVNKILKLLSEGLEDEAASWELRCTQEEIGFNCHLDAMARYSETLKEMHLRRVSNLVDYNNNEKSMEKAKPAKKAAAEEAYNTAKDIYEKTTTMANKEIKSFKQMRLKSSEQALSQHAEIQMKISQDFYTQLFHTRKALLELQL